MAEFIRRQGGSPEGLGAVVRGPARSPTPSGKQGAAEAAPMVRLSASAGARSSSAPSDDAPVFRRAATVQRTGGAWEGETPAETVQQLAREGARSASGRLPYAEQIQRSFGRHDISRIQAHQGPVAGASARAMGADAYAAGDHVVFAGTPDLHTAAHEAAHVVQQRGGVQLAGGVGQVGDPYEQHADAVADRVRTGESAEGLLDAYAGGRNNSSGGLNVQLKIGPDGDGKTVRDKDGNLYKAQRTGEDWEGIYNLLKDDQVVVPEVSEDDDAYEIAEEPVVSPLEHDKEALGLEHPSEKLEKSSSLKDEVVPQKEEEPPELKSAILSGEKTDFLQRYEITATRGSDGVIEPVGVSRGKEAALPQKPLKPLKAPAYVVNVLTIPSDPSPAEIAEAYYNQGFADKEQVLTRLAMVVGVNKFKSLDGQSATQIEKHRDTLDEARFNVRAFAMLWNFNWNRTKKNKVKTDDDGYQGARAAFLEQTPQVQEEVLKYEKSRLKQDTIPYALLRERVTVSNETKSFVKLLSEHNQYVYIHLGDADAVSLKAPEDQPHSLLKPMQNKTKAPVTHLFDRYDQVLGEHNHPLMAVGGYEFRFKGTSGDDKADAAKGDLDRTKAADYLTWLANQLDQAVRLAVASLNPALVYPTEPNTVFLVSDGKYDFYTDPALFPKKRTAPPLFGDGAREGAKLRKSLLGAKTVPNQKIVYDPRASIATDSRRFTLRDKDHVQHDSDNPTYGALRDKAAQGEKPQASYTAQVVDDMMNQKQSYAAPGVLKMEVQEAISEVDMTKFANRVVAWLTEQVGGAPRELPTATKADFAKQKSKIQEHAGAAEAIIKAVQQVLAQPENKWLLDEIKGAIEALYKERTGK